MRSPVRPALRVTVASAVLVASAASAETRFVLSSEPGDWVGAGELRVATPANGQFFADGDADRVWVRVDLAQGIWDLVFHANDGLRPGTFTIPSPAGAPVGSFTVGGEGRGCQGAGSFTVRDYAVDASGDVKSLAVDFEQRCEDSTAKLTGTLRYRSGDPACAAAADGTPCDDFDLCTHDDRCLAGACAGTDAASPACPSSDACHDPGVCHAGTGACLPGFPRDGTPCDDGNPLTAGDQCEEGLCGVCPPDDQCREYDYSPGGVCYETIHFGAACDDGNGCTAGDRCTADGCIAEGPAECFDGNPCTVDGCDPVIGCTYDTLPGCWVLATHSVVTARASGELGGQSVECGPLRCQRIGGFVLILPGDGTYRIPAGSAECRRPTVLPDEVGSVRRRRDGRLFLRPSNRAAIKRALRRCTGRRAAFSGSQWIHIASDGLTLIGESRTRVTVFAELPIQETLVSRVTGQLGRRPLPPALHYGLPECAASLRLLCRPR
jgi:hypothetical protein